MYFILSNYGISNRARTWLYMGRVCFVACVCELLMYFLDVSDK